MKLEGWNQIPEGYGADFDLPSAPLWLRTWFRTPLLDRFAYPQMVRRGLGYLTPHPGVPPDARGKVRTGWRIRPEYQPPGSITHLH